MNYSIATLLKSQLDKITLSVRELLLETVSNSSYVLKNEHGERYDSHPDYTGEDIIAIGEICIQIVDNDEIKNAYLLEANEKLGIRVYCNNHCDDEKVFSIDPDDIYGIEEQISLIVFFESISTSNEKIKLLSSSMLHTYYNPPISDNAKKIISQLVSPCQIGFNPSDIGGKTFDLGTIIEELSEINDIDQDDMNLLHDLSDINVGYIEI